MNKVMLIILGCLSGGLTLFFLAQDSLPSGSFESNTRVYLNEKNTRLLVPTFVKIEFTDDRYHLFFLLDGRTGFNSNGTVSLSGNHLRFIQEEHERIFPEKAVTVTEQAFIRNGAFSDSFELQAIDEDSFLLSGDYLSLYFESIDND
ncbi:hypothetical protein Sps_01992 [Shewanella psychrophila]|uniref:DUF306 domain-containing protein n=1 Tax=Shewanella psychrophila TaxID=225848 RepID=A0A1S6HNR9_9GAMM|nr:hypothetical protein [Shewanella psychrophila]AQS37152.1 hypothetical protein Sps_01992 [Shewanella psychrophila]